MGRNPQKLGLDIGNRRETSMSREDILMISVHFPLFPSATSHHLDKIWTFRVCQVKYGRWPKTMTTGYFSTVQ